ncbi:transposase, partial [Streptomyces sp. NPDC096311]|uniref:transposase n=1 Tax=Streptomyces sp. NPDC096311 TaxID=3366083 RepID=UPI0038027EB3
MGSKQRKYDAEFREGAVRIVIETGKPIPEVAEDLGVHPGTLHSWVSRWRRNGSASSDRALAEYLIRADGRRYQAVTASTAVRTRGCAHGSAAVAARWWGVLLRLAYLGVTNAFALLRLLPMSDREKDVEILALRHQIAVLERQLSGQRVRFDPGDRALLAALLHGLPRKALQQIRLLVRPDTVLRRHRDLTASRHAAASRPRRGGRPRTVHSIRALVLRLAKENPNWEYPRLHGELLVPGVKVAASTVWEILKDTGVDPAPDRASTTWTDFLHSQADALLACDFFETVTLTGTRLYVLAVIEHA